MCGRYELTTTKSDLWERYHLPEEGDLEELLLRPEVFPATTCPVIIPGPYLVELMWGFTEPFSKQPLINARAETILQKPTFREPFKYSRCIIPATAFFEWEKTEKQKIRRRISVSDLPIFSLAGIRKRYPQEDGTFKETFSIITTSATEELKKIHPRMPVVLSLQDEEFYLNQEKSASEVRKLLTPSPLSFIID